MGETNNIMTTEAVAIACQDEKARKVLAEKAAARMADMPGLSGLTQNTREDIQQDSILTLVEYLRGGGELQPKSGSLKVAFFSLLATIVKRRSTDHRRKQMRLTDAKAVILQDPPTSQTGPEALAERKDLLESILLMVEELPDLYRDVIYKLIFEGVSRREYAEQERVVESTIRARLSRALTMIRERIDHE